MASSFVHTCLRIRDVDAALRFYGALGFEERGRLNFSSAYNVYLRLPGDGDRLELTVNIGRDEPYDLGEPPGLDRQGRRRHHDPLGRCLPALQGARVPRGSDLRRGVANLLVSDGSVFTTGAAANPTLTIVALAIRQAEHIGDRIRTGAL